LPIGVQQAVDDYMRNAYRAVAVPLSFMYERCCGLEPKLCSPTIRTRAIAQVQTHRAHPGSALQHLCRILAESIRQTRGTKAFAAASASRFDVLCALAAEMARSTVVVPCILTVPSLAQDLPRNGSKCCKLDVVFKVVNGIRLFHSCFILDGVNFKELRPYARFDQLIAGHGGDRHSN
jgi:hypothetical protein